MEMEQYSGMGEEMQNNYSLWEQDYYAMVSDSNEAQTNYYANNFPITTDQHNHAAAQPHHEVAEAGRGKRRRSKAAQSTTFLNASISNFRALVQQHTGCHSANSSPKGPITLCFATSAASTHANKLY